MNSIPHSLFQEAVAHHQQGRLDQAEDLYRRAAALGHFDAAYLLATLLLQRQRLPEALSAVDAALAQKPEAPQAVLLKGVILKFLDQRDAALATFRQAVAIKPDYVEAWYNGGLLLVELGRFDEAVAAFDSALTIKTDPEIWLNRGIALHGLSRLADALESFERASKLAPGLVEPHGNRGQILLALKRPDEALAAFDTALEMNPGMVEAWMGRAVAQNALKRHAEELASLDHALGLAPDYALAWNNRGLALQVLKRDDEALASYDKAVALAPGLAEAWKNRAMQLHNLQRSEEALASLERALAAAPDYAPALLAKGAILCAAGRPAEGLAIYAQRAQKILGASSGSNVEHKERHDREQSDYLSGRGISVSGLHIGGGERVARAINPNALAEEQWRQNRPQIVVMDDFLTPEALSGLRRFCWESTIWNRVYDDGYLGAMPEHGFACPLLAQIAEELSATFPAIFAGHPLMHLWGFKYDSRLSGIRIHADQAAVNVNFWITPDEANLDPDRGGLVIWDAAAPADWSFAHYNGDEAAARTFLTGAGAKSQRVPYRANRAVIFDSDLFHETDTIAFKDGYLNRRINITLLYGRRV